MTHQTKSYLLGIVGIVTIAGLLWWGGQQQDNKSNIPIKVGVIAPITGALADYGVAFQNGFSLANDDLDNQQVEFIFEDSEYDPKKAISAFRKLTEVDQVAVVMDWGATTSEAIIPLVEAADTPFITITIDPTATRASKLIIRGDLNRPEDFAEKTWEYLRSKNLKNIAVVKTELLYINIMLDALIEAKQADEQVTIIDTYQFGDQDFRSSITKIKERQFDALGVYLVSGQVNQFYRQARELDLIIETFGTDFFESQSEIDAAQGTMNGAVYANMAVSDEFKKNYRDRFGNESQITFAGGAYDLAAILIQKVDYSSKDTVLGSLQGLKDFVGVKGPYQYVEQDGDRYFSKPTYMKKIENNTIKTLTEL